MKKEEKLLSEKIFSGKQGYSKVKLRGRFFEQEYTYPIFINSGDHMNRKLKTGVSALGSAMLVVLMTAQTQFAKEDDFCANVDRVTFDVSLSAKHPLNRCATDKPENSVSWTKWFSGRSSSYQFHYLDLLELLSKTSDDSTKQHRGQN